MTTTHTILRRYTDLPAVLYLLHQRTITLLDPAAWDDTNDSYYLNLYKQRSNLSSVLALCFTQAAETYHHWRIFAPGASGICVCFKRANLLFAVKGQAGLLHRDVRYLTLTKMRAKRPKVEDLPFLKRIAFQNEAEFRFVYQSSTDSFRSLDVAIRLKCIDRVVVSPWIHPSLFQHVKATLRSVPGCSGLKVTRSTLIGNEKWKSLGDGAA